MKTPAQAALVEAEPPAPQTIARASDAVSMFERLASDPSVDVAKLEKLIEMQERILRHNAEAAFNAAFAEMQPEIPVIAERGMTDKGRFAELEDIVEAVRPILGKYGFALSHRTEWPAPNQVRIVGILRHRGGHQQTSEFLSAPDQSGSKNGIQALGSAVSYGRRYTTKDLLCIVSRGEGKDDGADSSRPDGPDGFDDWYTDLSAVADEGIAKLTATFNKSADEYKKHLLKFYPREWAALKTKAQKAGRS